MTHPMKTKSLRKQLIISLCLSLAVLCVLGNIAVFTYIKTLDLEEFDEELVNDLQSVATLITSKAQGVTIQDPFPSKRTGYIQISSEDGDVLLRSPSLENFKLPVLNMQLGQVDIQDCPLPNGQHGRMAVLAFIPQFKEEKARPGYKPDHSGKPVHLAFAKSREDLDRILNLEFLFSLLVGGILILSAAFVVFVSVNWSFRRLGDFVDQVKSIDPKAIVQRLREDHLPTEMIPLRDQFNVLLSNLEASFNREKRFNANVAHELRTPIAELRLLNEVALQEIEGRPASPSSRAYFEDALQLIARMERLIEVLTLLNRFEAKETTPVIESLDLAVIIQNSWNVHAREAEEKNIVGSFNIPEQTKIDSDRAILSAILENIVSNAIAYSPSGSTLTCRVHIEEPIYQLEFTNPCTDLSSKDLAFLSEPFWQKDLSRTSTDHVGLGLTLVKKYCNVLSIKLDMWLEENGAFHVLLMIPNQAAVHTQEREQTVLPSSSSMGGC